MSQNGKFRSTDDGATIRGGNGSKKGNGKKGGIQEPPDLDSWSVDKPRRNNGQGPQNVHQGTMAKGGVQRNSSQSSGNVNGSHSNGNRGNDARIGGDFVAQLLRVRAALNDHNARVEGQAHKSAQAKGKGFAKEKGKGKDRQERLAPASRALKARNPLQIQGGGTSFKISTQASSGATYRVYHDANTGEEVARHRLATPAEFNARIQRVASKDYHLEASGMRESPVFHGSEAIEMDTIRNGRAAKRLAGHLELFDVSTPAAPVVAGMRIAGCPVNPQWLGGSPAANALVFGQCRVVHAKPLYKSYADPLEPGAIALSFANDPDAPQMLVGLPTLKSFAEGTYNDIKVVDSGSIEISPSDMNVKFDSEGGASQSIQGMLRVLTVSPMASSKGLGTTYLEYDIEFFDPILADAVNMPITGNFSIIATAANLGAGNIVSIACSTAAIAWKVTFTLNPPPDDSWIFLVRFLSNTDVADSPIVQAPNDAVNKIFGTPGTEVYMRLFGYGSKNMTDGTVTAVFFNTEEAAIAGTDGGMSSGQLFVSVANGSSTSTTTCSFTAVPLK